MSITTDDRPNNDKISLESSVDRSMSCMPPANCLCEIFSENKLNQCTMKQIKAS